RRGVKEGLIKSTRADGGRFLVREQAQKRRHTLCMLSFCNVFPDEKIPLDAAGAFNQYFLRNTLKEAWPHWGRPNDFREVKTHEKKSPAKAF
ncbi:MAG: hypothetical protein LUB63_00490, partial [Oscillospiraceae bacterium]|nr:hypothetical protein [Oscillospiraceae bacterium]